MNIFEMLGIAAFLLNCVGAFPYWRDIFKGNTKPHSITWLIFTVMSTIALLAQREIGAGPSLYMSFSFVVVCFINFVLALRFGVTSFSRFDKMCFLLAIVSIALWQGLNLPIIGVIGPVMGDFFGILPTIKKAKIDPTSENRLSWIMATVAALLGTIAVGKFDWQLLLYPGYIFLVDFWLLSILFKNQRKSLQV